jgi:hypothetical protein
MYLAASVADITLSSKRMLTMASRAWYRLDSVLQVCGNQNSQLKNIPY